MIECEKINGGDAGRKPITGNTGGQFRPNNGRVERRSLDAGDSEGTRQPFAFCQHRFQVLEPDLEEPVQMPGCRCAN